MKQEQKKIESFEPNKLHIWFFSLWFKRAKNGWINCEECNKPLHELGMLDLCRYSHILNKSQYPEMKFEEDNIMIVCGDCHTLYGSFPEKAKKQYLRYKKLLNEQN